MSKEHKKGKALFVIILLVLVVIIYIFATGKGGNNPTSANVLGEKTGKISYNNGDNTYRSSEKNIDYDDESGALYFNDLMIVYTFEDISSDKAEELAELVEGEVVGEISGVINAFQIKVPDLTYEGMMNRAELLMENEDVMYASYDSPVNIYENASDTWNRKGYPMESDIGNESNPGGNDWWAEAIGAYTAWEYSDVASPINVGVLDNGFETNHDDLIGKISFLPNYEKNSADKHGTHVAGLIAAASNGVGVRGVADNSNLVCVDWTPNTEDRTSRDYCSYISTGEYLEIYKQMIENDVKIINNSWGKQVLSEEEFERLASVDDAQLDIYKFDVHSEDAYEKYLRVHKSSSERTGINCMNMMTSLLLNGEDDFIIVQSAGNGYEDSKKSQGMDAKGNGFFCAIDNELFDSLNYTKKYKLLSKGIDYKKIKSHIFIVAAMKNEKSGNDYKVTDFSNYGKNVDICAPGENIFSAITGNDYRNLSGTSMAAPIVAGSAAYLWSINPEKSAEEIKEILIETSLEKAYSKIGGRIPVVNIGEAVKKYPGKKQAAESEQKNINVVGSWQTAYKRDVDIMVRTVVFKTDGTFEDLELSYTYLGEESLNENGWEISNFGQYGNYGAYKLSGDELKMTYEGEDVLGDYADFTDIYRVVSADNSNLIIKLETAENSPDSDFKFYEGNSFSMIKTNTILSFEEICKRMNITL